MNIRPLLAFALSLSALFAALPSHAQNLQIPVGQQGQDKQSIARPRAGMRQEQVREQFGNPLQWTNPVGEPPISKWIYQDFIVVFEYDQVLHSVLVHTPQGDVQTNQEVSGTN